MQAGPGQALGVVGLGEVAQLVDLLAGEGSGAALDVNEAHGAAVSHGAGEHAEAAVLDDIGDILDLEAETHVGLVGAEAVHGLLPGHPLEGSLDVHVQHFLKDALHEAFLNAHDVVLVDEGHFEVDLGELGLTVGA